MVKRRRRLIIDAMSSFGALPLDVRKVPFDAAVASANKCLEGVPGMGFAIVGKEALATSRGNAHSLSLDLFDQWTALEGNGQWRFTPPTHVVAALDAALEQLEAEGGVAARHARYSQNCRVLLDGMRGLGFQTLLPDALQAPTIVTFLTPADPAFRFEDFYAARVVGDNTVPGREASEHTRDLLPRFWGKVLLAKNKKLGESAL